jgi:hypothetical protein
LLLSDTDEELMEWQTKFEERIALLETKISKLGREMDDEGATSSSLIEKTKHVACDIAKLQAEADVILFFLFLPPISPFVITFFLPDYFCYYLMVPIVEVHAKFLAFRLTCP